MSAKGQLYFNGVVRTMDRARPLAGAVAVRDGTIIAVGEKDACAGALEKGYQTIDLKGRTLLPGFIDTHLHPIMLIYFSMNCDLGAISSMGGLKLELRRALARKNDSTWLAGLNFDEQNLQEKRVPTRQDLDDVSRDRPVIVIKHDGHSVFANTCAIESAGVTASTPDPEAGKIEREADGSPSGVFREAAVKLILNAMPMPELPALIDGARATFRRLASLGLTSLGVVLQTGEEGPAGSAGAFDVMAMQLFSADCPFSLYSLLITGDVSELEGLRSSALANGPHRLGGVKLFADGTFGSSTAYMQAPFADDAGIKGHLMHQPEELYRQMAAAHNDGWQVCIHAIGDAANRLCAELYGRLFKEFPGAGRRHRIEHASIMDDWTVQELSRLGIAVSTQPMFIHSEKGWLERRLGPDRCRSVYPFRSLLDAGIRLSGASDGPIESQDVLHALQCCVTREGFEPHQCITVEEALRMYTVEAAFSQFEEGIKGSIAAGKRADLVILSGDPVATDPGHIKDIKVEMTVAGGTPIFTL
jgi:predicted amidohydrolase YtcJ